MVVDYERAWLALKKEVVSKQSHGKSGLLEAMAEIEMECEIPEPADQPAAPPPLGATGNGPESGPPLTDEEVGYGNGSKESSRGEEAAGAAASGLSSAS